MGGVSYWPVVCYAVCRFGASYHRGKKINSLHVFATFLSVKTVSAKVHVNSVLVRALIIHVA